MSELEQVQAIRAAVQTMKTARTGTYARDNAERFLANAGVDPARPDDPPHPFRFRNMLVLPAATTREQAKAHLKALESRPAWSPAR